MPSPRPADFFRHCLPAFLLLGLAALTAIAAAPARAADAIPADAAIAKDFGPDSATLTHDYHSLRGPGDFVMLQGFNNYRAYQLYENALKAIVVDGVACLEIERFLLLSDDPGSSGRVFNRCVAQDAGGTLWVLRENDATFGAHGARLLLPATPRAGEALLREEDHTLTVVDTDASVTLRNEAAFHHCLRIDENVDGQDMSTYYAPGTGMVYILDSHDNTFELKAHKRR
jgi:hypothetical protein